MLLLFEKVIKCLTTQIKTHGIIFRLYFKYLCVLENKPFVNRKKNSHLEITIRSVAEASLARSVGTGLISSSKLVSLLPSWLVSFSLDLVVEATLRCWCLSCCFLIEFKYKVLRRKRDLRGDIDMFLLVCLIALATVVNLIVWNFTVDCVAVP